VLQKIEDLARITAARDEIKELYEKNSLE